ncbi:MAG: hypothetical protein PHX61_06320 [Alphaproteobacteria bacterium]|nr:hypothetical protein [Alphaproteobacteria bacterium]
MKIVMKKSELANAMTVLGRIVNEKANLAAWKSVRFSVKDGVMRISALDPEQCMTLKLASAKTEGDFESVIPYSELKEFVKSGKNGEIGFDFTKDFVTVSEEINGQSISRQTKLVDMKDYPEFVSIGRNAKSLTLPAGFTSLLGNAAQIVNKHEVRRALQGINLNKDGIAATNGKELIHIELPLELNEDITIPVIHSSLFMPDQRKHTLKIWTDNDVKQKFFAVETEAGTYIGKAIPGNFPNWNQVIPKSKNLDVSMKLASKEIVSLIEFMKRVPKHEPHNEIKLSLESNQLTASVEHAQDMKLSLPVEFRGRTYTGNFSINKDYLQRLLMLGHDTLDMSSGEHLPMVASGGIGRYIFMPILVSSLEVKKEEKIEFKTNALKTENNEKENVKMEENKRLETVQTESANPLDDLNRTIEDFRGKLKSMFEESTTISRKVKEAVIQQKQKEREFVMAKRAIEKIKMVSGF